MHICKYIDSSKRNISTRTTVSTNIHVAYVHVQILTCTHKYVRRYVNANVHTHTCVYTHIYIYLHMRIHFYIHIYTRIYACTCAYVYIYIYMYVYMCTYIFSFCKMPRQCGNGPQLLTRPQNAARNGLTRQTTGRRCLHTSSGYAPGILQGGYQTKRGQVYIRDIQCIPLLGTISTPNLS